MSRLKFHQATSSSETPFIVTADVFSAQPCSFVCTKCTHSIVRLSPAIFILQALRPSSSELTKRLFSILCLTRDFIRQGHTREKCTAQPVRAARRSIEGNGRGEAVTSRRYGNCLMASKQGARTAQPVRAATRLQA